LSANSTLVHFHSRRRNEAQHQWCSERGEQK